jgi:hypothetical protein
MGNTHQNRAEARRGHQPKRPYKPQQVVVRVDLIQGIFHVEAIKIAGKPHNHKGGKYKNHLQIRQP